MTLSLEHLRAVVRRAAVFLTEKVRSDRYTLDAFASDGSPCKVHQQGRICAGFFIVSAIRDLLGPGEKETLLSRIDAENRGGTWGDCMAAPVDADDTAFALRTQRLLGRKAPENGLLSFYQPESRLFSTFKPGAKVRFRIVRDLTPENNYHCHPEVAANVYCLLWSLNRRAYVNEELIESTQSADGSWESFYYPGPYYGTRIFLGLLRQMARMAEQRERGRQFVLSTQNSDGGWGTPSNPYETALAVEALATSEDADSAIDAGVAFLVDGQREDGSWEFAGPIWRYPYTQGISWYGYDANRVVATSACVAAIRGAIRTRTEAIGECREDLMHA